MPETALKRLVSLYVVQALEDKYLDEVYSNLVDCYLWSWKSRSIDGDEPEVRKFGLKKGLRIVDAKPVVFEE